MIHVLSHFLIETEASIGRMGNSVAENTLIGRICNAAVESFTGHTCGVEVEA